MRANEDDKLRSRKERTSERISLRHLKIGGEIGSGCTSISMRKWDQVSWLTLATGACGVCIETSHAASASGHRSSSGSASRRRQRSTGGNLGDGARQAFIFHLSGPFPYREFAGRIDCTCATFAIQIIWEYSISCFH